MSLRDYGFLVRKRWLTILVALVVCVGVGVGATLLSTKMYASTTRLFVSTQTPDTAADLLTGSNFTQQRVKSYADIVSSPKVLDSVVLQLGLKMNSAALGTKISTNVPLNTVIIEITALDASPLQAQRIVNAVGESLTQVVSRIETRSDGRPSLVSVTIVQPGTYNATPDSPKPLLNIALSIFIGLVLGLGLAILRDRLDLRLRTAEEVEDISETNVLGVVPFDAEAPKHPLIVHSNPRSLQAEAYRQLRTNVHFAEIDNKRKSIVVSSSVPSEGKTTTACNLAIALADTGARVLLIDCDFRKPDVHNYMGIEGAVGLTNYLIDQVGLSDAIQDWAGKLDVLVAGKVPPNPSELLGSEKFASLIQLLERRYDHIVVDAAPLLPVTDAAILSKITSGVILVVGIEKTTRPQLQGSIHHLKSVNGNILGTVLNKVPTRGFQSYGYGYGYGYGAVYGEAQGQKKAQRKESPVSSK